MPRARDVDVRRQVLVLGSDAHADGDQAQQQQLPPAVEAERATVCELDEVVEEADCAAPEGDEEHRQRGHRVGAEREEGDRGGEQDQQPAHHRRALLGEVVLGPLFPDVLAELVAAQELDELRADQDRDQQGDDPRDQHPAQALTAASASATRSSPTARDALTRTQSPGRTAASTAATALSASGAQLVIGIPLPPAR